MRAARDIRTVGLNHISRRLALIMRAVCDMRAERDDGGVTCVQCVTCGQCVTCVRPVSCIQWDYPTTLFSNRLTTSSDYGCVT